MTPSDYFTLTGEPAPLLLAAVHDGHAVRPELADRYALSPREHPPRPDGLQIAPRPNFHGAGLFI